MKTRLLIVSLFTLLACISPSYAQWYQQLSGTSYDLNAINCLNDTVCYAVGFRTNIRKTTDGGANIWVTGGSTGGVSDKLVVNILDKDTILIGQANGTFKRTTNGSTSSIWSNDIFGGNTAFGIYDIFRVSGKKIIAVGGSASNTSTGGHMISTSIDAGVNWTPINVSGEPTMFGVYAVGASKYIAVGGKRTIFRSTDAGATWTKVKTGGTDTIFYDLHFPTPAVGYAVGGTPATPTTGGIIYKTLDSGKTWTKANTVALPLTNTLYGVHFTNKDTGYVVGNRGTIEATIDGGATWTKQISPDTADLNKIYFPSKMIGYIVGANGVILKTTDGGFIPKLVVNAGGNKSICPGFCATIGGTNIVTGGTVPYTYSWSPVANTGTSLVVCPTVKTTYTITVTDANNITATDTVMVALHNLPVISFSGLPSAYCLNGNKLTLTGSPTGGTFSGAGITGTSLNPSIAGSGTHTVSYTYTDINGCVQTTPSQSVTITSVPSSNPLCMVTVDSVNANTNIIIWQKPVSNSIDSFRIYRKNGSGTLTYIGHVDYSNPTKYTDASGINPSTKSYAYALSVVDTCGAVSALSDTNSTIFVKVTDFDTPNKFTIQWSDYHGFIPTEYEIWRKDTATTPWEKIGTKSFYAENQFVDTTFPSGSARYKIRAVNPSTRGCTIDSLTTIQATFSNITDDYTGVAETSLDKLLSVYPNPNNGTFTFLIGGIKYHPFHVKMFDLFGKLIYESAIGNNKSEISVPNIKSGIYQLQIITATGIANKKVIIK